MAGDSYTENRRVELFPPKGRERLREEGEDGGGGGGETLRDSTNQ